MTVDLALARKGIGDREVYLGLSLAIWGGILTGFVPEIATEGFDFPWIVHLHAVVFMGWLVLLTVQCLLIGTDRRDLHRQLGIGGAILAAVMLVVGPETALMTDRIKHAQDGGPIPFIAIQMADMISFAVLTGAGLLLRRRAQLHKTLLLLATISLSVAGFARGFGNLVAPLFPGGPIQFYAHIYSGTDLLILALGCYQILYRRTWNPAYLLGSALIVALHLTAVTLYFWPAWKEISLRLIGA